MSITVSFSLWFLPVFDVHVGANVHRRNNFHLGLLCAGQYWRGCSRRHLGQLSSMAVTSAPTWTPSGGSWECARSTMCCSMSKWLQVSLLCFPSIIGVIVIFFFCIDMYLFFGRMKEYNRSFCCNLITCVMRAQCGLLFHINTWLSSRSVQRGKKAVRKNSEWTLLTPKLKFLQTAAFPAGPSLICLHLFVLASTKWTPASRLCLSGCKFHSLILIWENLSCHKLNQVKK